MADAINWRRSDRRERTVDRLFDPKKDRFIRLERDYRMELAGYLGRTVCLRDPYNEPVAGILHD